MAKIFSALRLKQLKPTWEHKEKAIIWRLHFSLQSKIVGELRDNNNKTTSFFCLDAITGKQIWKEIILEEKWWIGIEDVIKDWVIIHGYSRPDMPEHQGIWVLDINTGRLLWKNDLITYWFVSDEKIYAYKYLFDKRVAYEINIINGEIIFEYSDNLEYLQNIYRNRAINQQNVILPEVFEKENTVPIIKGKVDSLIKDEFLPNRIEYFSKNNILILSYYKQGYDKRLENIILIYDYNKNAIIYEDLLANNIVAPSSDTFFIKDETLYFIKNQKIITAMHPWKS